MNKANRSVLSPTHPGGIFCNHIQHWLNIRRRTGNHAENLARRSLLFQRFLEFVEQPYVLDRNDRLIGKCFEKLDLHRREGAHLDATGAQPSDNFSVLTKGSA